MRPLACRFAVALAVFALALPVRLAAAEPPPPSDAELTKYIAVQNALAGDVARRDQICELLAGDASGSGASTDDPAVAGRRLEANPIFGPLVRKHGLSGRRYVELSVQVAGVLIGAAMADESDAAARAKGRPAKGRETLLASSPDAPPILARQQDLTAALEAVQAICGESDDDGYDDESAAEDEGEI